MKRNYKSAIEYFQLASQSGNVLAYYNLAQIHATGISIRSYFVLFLYNSAVIMINFRRWSTAQLSYSCRAVQKCGRTGAMVGAFDGSIQ